MALRFFPVFVLMLSLSLLFLVFTFKPSPRFSDVSRRQTDEKLPPWFKTPKWYSLIGEKIAGRKIKVGFVNVGEEEQEELHVHGSLAETVHVEFDRVSKDLEWKDLYPEWIDETGKWRRPTCPEIPMPKLQEAYKNLDVVVARLPCHDWPEKEGIRDVFRLQVNLVVANIVVQNGWVEPGLNRTVYVVFIGSCGPMQEIFRCDDRWKQVGDHWVYKPELRRLKQKVEMPVGSCQIGLSLAETGKGAKNNYTTHYHPREAYATVLHSSEAYVCGAIALAQSIIQSNSTKDLILLHDGSISRKSRLGLRAAGWKTRRIQRIRSPFSRKGTYNEWNYSKLRVWQITDYDKVIFIDADLLVLRNMDELFRYPQLSAAPNSYMLFNSGVMMIEPSSCLFEDLMLKSFKVESYNGGDQGFLNEMFPWWHRWPRKTNNLKMFMKGKHELGDDHYAIHYLGLKPWMCYRDYDCNWDMEDRQIFASDEAHEKWWRVYDAMPESLKDYCALTEKMDARIRKWRGKARSAGLADRHWEIKVKDPRQYKLAHGEAAANST